MLPCRFKGSKVQHEVRESSNFNGICSYEPIQRIFLDMGRDDIFERSFTQLILFQQKFQVFGRYNFVLDIEKATLPLLNIGIWFGNGFRIIRSPFIRQGQLVANGTIFKNALRSSTLGSPPYTLHITEKVVILVRPKGLNREMWTLKQFHTSQTNLGRGNLRLAWVKKWVYKPTNPSGASNTV